MMYTLNELLKKVVDIDCSDLHLSVGTPPRVRKNGQLTPIEGEKLLDLLKKTNLRPNNNRLNIMYDKPSDYLYYETINNKNNSENINNNK